MPQMAPISWLVLFLMFILTLIMFSMMNYYTMLPNSPKISTKSGMMTPNMNWKW
uniref:ATP synthase complex subunit 8 n=1 Tax=Dasypogon diadema TaxID=468822 RepID=A0A5S9H8C7_9MUSC|nr:ATP synthase F0 subunit 8 [Dasypogon diadema]AYW52657.1 ATP synthase F0 subunit 8 [Dasypogon diadema]